MDITPTAEELQVIRRADEQGLQRFVDAQDRNGMYQRAVEEIKSGRKQSHWIWYIFPQMRGLGRSLTSQYYGINGREEAKAYAQHPVLFPRLLEVTQLVLDSPETISNIFADDAIKVKSSMMLFDSVSSNPLFKQVLSKCRPR